MAETWSLLKRIGKKKYDAYKESRDTGDRIDLNLPLGIRIRGLVDIPQVDFILAGNDLKLEYPGPTCSVLSFGLIMLGDKVFHRFYLESSKGMHVLETLSDKHKEVQTCKLFAPLDEVYPEDWDFWLSPRDGYIGYSEFQIKDGTSYFRVWDDPERSVVIGEDDQGNKITRVPPIEFLETVNLDEYGKEREMVRHTGMLYSRRISPDLNEFVLVSAVDTEDGASVQIMAGIPLEPMSIKVI